MGRPAITNLKHASLMWLVAMNSTTCSKFVTYHPMTLSTILAAQRRGTFDPKVLMLGVLIHGYM